MTSTINTLGRSRWPWQNSLQWRLISVVLLVVIIPVVAIFALNYVQTADTLRQSILADIKSLTSVVTNDLEAYLFERRGDVQLLSHSAILWGADNTPETKIAYLKTLQEAYQAYESFYITDPAGQITAATDSTTGDQSGQDWYKSALAQQAVFTTDVRFLESAQSNILTVSSPIFADTGAVVGVVAANINVQKLIDILAHTKIGENNEAIIANNQGRIVIDSHTDDIFKDVNHLKSVQAALRGETGAINDISDDGVPSLVYYTPDIGLKNWVVFVAVPLTELNAPLQELALREVLQGLVSVLIIAVAVLLVARRIVQPIQQLTAIAGRLSAGEFNTEVPVQGTDEIGQLANTFRSMSSELQNFVSTLEERVQSRTHDLSTTIEVSRLANSIYSQQELLPQVVEFIRSKFDLYYTQIYLLDEAGRFALLRAGTGEVGQQLLARHHKLDLEETSLVARAAQTRQAVIVSDTDQDASHKPNPLLPDTRSETAVPMLFGNVVLGVLDMQANRPNTFTEENASVFEALAGQIAAVLHGAEAFDEAQAATSQAEAINERFTNETWGGYLDVLASGERVGYEYDLEAPRPLSDQFEASSNQQIDEPIVVRGAKIGSIVVKNDDTRFHLQQDDQELIQDTARHVAQALDQFRAFDEVKRSQEQLRLQTVVIQESLEQAERLSMNMETVAQVSATAATILDVGELLKTVSDLTKERFGLYHAHIYLLDEAGENLLLAAGAGEAGDIMKARNHAISMDNPRSLVVAAARERQAIIANDVAAAPDFLPNPLLPETRSELALPMVVAGKLVGVLDVQANTVNRFTDEDVRVQTALANQIAIAVENGRAFQENLQTAERLRELDRLKSQFLANMSHELRTPLNSIIGYSEVLLDGIDGELNADATEDVQSIHNGGKHLLTIINDILDLAKIEAGQMFIELGETNLMAVVEDVLNTCDILARNKGLELKIRQRSEIPAVKGDAIRLKQIIINLVNNAIKFTETGSITIDMGLDENHMVKVCIIDTGMGMTPDELEGLFQQFHQVDGSPTRRAGGSGLGLVISRHLVTMHGGVVNVESEKGVGSNFWFTVEAFKHSTQNVNLVTSSVN